MDILIVFMTIYFAISAIVFLFIAIMVAIDGDSLIDEGALFIVLTFLPIGWPFYIVSWFRSRNPHREVFDELRYDGRYVAYDPYYDDYDDYQPEETTLESVSSFENDLEGAQEIYAVLRGDKAVEIIQRQRLTEQERFDKATAKLAELAEKLKKWQLERQEATVAIREIDERLKAREAVSDEVKAEELAAELAQILSIKGVYGVRRFGEQLSILIRGGITYKGRTYDKGDWEIRISPESGRIWSCETRSGVRSSWRTGEYPDYRYNGGFCFGSNEYFINENLQNGQYLQAIELAATCINSVNRDHRQDIPRAFKVLKEESVA